MILVVGLSPAWQRTLAFEKIVSGRVNRATHVDEVASGKGVNVARVASILGVDVRLLTVAGGDRGGCYGQNWNSNHSGHASCRLRPRRGFARRCWVAMSPRSWWKSRGR